MEVQPGDFVTAEVAATGWLVQGVVISGNGDGALWVQEEPSLWAGGRYLCKADVERVPDDRLFPHTLRFVQWVRERVAGQWSVFD
jgi:hypothetical protein